MTQAVIAVQSPDVLPELGAVSGAGGRSAREDGRPRGAARRDRAAACRGEAGGSRALRQAVGRRAARVQRRAGSVERRHREDQRASARTRHDAGARSATGAHGAAAISGSIRPGAGPRHRDRRLRPHDPARPRHRAPHLDAERTARDVGRLRRRARVSSAWSRRSNRSRSRWSASAKRSASRRRCSPSGKPEPVAGRIPPAQSARREPGTITPH